LLRCGSSLTPSSLARALAGPGAAVLLQGEVILGNPLTILICWLGYGLARLLRLPCRDAAPAAVIGASNHFEVATATSTMLFGLSSRASLATVVGVLIEVPVTLMLVGICRRTGHWFRAEFDVIATTNLTGETTCPTPWPPRSAASAADLIVAALERTIADKTVTYDFARLMEGATELRCSEIGTVIIGNMQPSRGCCSSRQWRIFAELKLTVLVVFLYLFPDNEQEDCYEQKS